MSKVQLTDAERETLDGGTSLFGWAIHDEALAHLVPVVESLVAARNADVWDEGYRKGADDDYALNVLGTHVLNAPNPYRKVPTDAPKQERPSCGEPHPHNETSEGDDHE